MPSPARTAGITATSAAPISTTSQDRYTHIRKMGTVANAP
jgi:hypothetical protein